MVQEDKRIHNEIIVQVRALLSRKAVFKNVSNKHWVTAQVLDPAIKHVRSWVCQPKENKISLSDYFTGKVADVNRLAYSCQQKDLVMSHNLLYMQHSPPGTDEKGLAFVVPAKRRQVTIDGCHHDAGHQGRDCTLSLMQERFWWPGMGL